MNQPQLGKKLEQLRREKHLTQEELVAKCNVSVRTIQRIEAGEVTPRVSTIKIILAALDADIESIQGLHHSNSKLKDMLILNFDDTTYSRKAEDLLQVAWIGGLVYLVLGLVETGLEYTRYDEGFDKEGETLYIVAKLIIFITYFLFLRGFVVLGSLFKNYLLKVGAYLMISGLMIISVIDIASLFIISIETYLMIQATESVMMGAVGIIFALSLLRLHDSMGSIAKVAGVLELIAAFLYITVILFFIGLAIQLPAVIIEIVILFKGYEIIKAERNLV